MLTHVATMVVGTLPLSVLVRRAGREHDSLLALLYTAVIAGFLAWWALPYIDWMPTADTLFAVQPWEPG